ncbi:MAG: dipeptidase [Thermoproteus sp.]|jgi:membrane dipeptidase|nr:dipeptidase [Thermoproteus sp.]
MIYDLHEDVAYHYFSGRRPDFDIDDGSRQSDLPKLKRAGVDLVFASIFPVATTYGSTGPGGAAPAGAKSLALEMFKMMYRLSERHGIAIVERAADLDRGGLKFLLLMEGADSLDDPSDLLLYFKLGLRALGITWNLDNKFGASCLSRRDYGLTAYGEELVALANRLGVILDLAHASRRTALDAISASRKPVVISHANAASIHRSPRNVDDEVLEALKRNGGVIGVTAIPSLVGERGTVQELVRHAVYIKESFGADMLAVGTDALGVDRMVEGLESVDRLPAFLELLREAGFGDSEVEAVAYKNAKRVIEANLS